jgi:hypothetical protein
MAVKLDAASGSDNLPSEWQDAAPRLDLPPALPPSPDSAPAPPDLPPPPDLGPDRPPDLAHDAAPMLPVRPSCSWQGPRCEAGETQMCAEGKVVAVQPCHALGCQDGNACVAPGSPSALARQTTGTLNTTVCYANPLGCHQCLHNKCCGEMIACGMDPACRKAWQCLETCVGLASCDACSGARTTSPALAAVFACASTGPCGGYCKLTDPCQGAPGNGSGYFCGGRLNADPGVLYLCSQKTTVGAASCAQGCSGGGHPDACAGSDPCAGSPFDGMACGSVLASASARADTLYECEGQVAVWSAPCRVCAQAAPGLAYQCQ